MPPLEHTSDREPSGSPLIDAKRKPRFIRLTRPSRLDVEFCIEAGKGLVGLLAGSKKRSQPEGETPLPRTFFGVCLAVPQSQLEADAVLGHLKELGVGSVRLDIGYGQNTEECERFVSALQAEGLSILLHLVPPLEAAGRMHSVDVSDAWRLFLEDCLECFAGAFDAIEIGTTINRASWSGCELEGFLAMWDVAHTLCAERGHTLVGPNVTDFEPQYNAGILGMLRRRKQLPDIHSNNLFAERTIEPEASDHKIIGPRFRHIHGYDLRKKMRLLAAVADRQGCARNWSTCAFWTIPRIRRLTSRPEEAMADYLVRYFVLCAGQGDFERIFWGPLVSYREGLVDDGTEDRRSSDGRDVVAFYAGYPGVPDQWRRRPAYSAYSAMMRQLSGYVYAGARCAGRGLEIHEFTQGERRCLVGWTANGALARLKDCIDAQSLAQLEFYCDRDGRRQTDCPDFLTESPQYLHWRGGASPVVSPDARPMPEVVAARPQEGHAYYAFETCRWRGILHARSRQEAEALAKTLQPDAILECPEQRNLRRSRNAIWTVVDPRGEGSIVVKKPRTIAWHKRFLDRKKPSKALRSWNGTSELMRRGIETPVVVAYFESKDRSAMLDNWFVCEQVMGGHSVREFFTRYAKGENQVEGHAFEDFAGQLIAFVMRMHGMGIFFRDLAGGNVLVREVGEGRMAFSLIDTARVQCHAKGLKLRHRLDDLKRLTLKLNAEQRSYFMQAYLSRLGQRFSPSHRIAFGLYALKTKLKRYKRECRRKSRK